MVAFDELIKQIAKKIRNSNKTILFSGAGISTPSGIPDFRSTSSGLWNKSDPMQVASLSAFENNPKIFFDWLHPLVIKSRDASPNQAHRIIAEMQRSDIIQTIITQNIDGLHQKAGAKEVLELHGNLNGMRCNTCEIEYKDSRFFTRFEEFREIPVCPACGSVLKPNIILYEETLPQNIWDQAVTASLNADTFIVVGSSLEVFPASSLPVMAYEHGATLCINNFSSTSCDTLTKYVFHMDVVVFFQKLREVYDG